MDSLASPSAFDDDFATLTGHPPFPWQRALFDRFRAGGVDNIPRVAELPTGLGKTSVIAVWLLALMGYPETMPRRLVYVVNRRTVVDQTTAEVQRLRENLPRLDCPRLMELAISTLRGQFADNAEWCADPSRPAVICGTVDMIGSRLLFEGYRIGFKSRPLHAGFLGQDTLLIHDEAHLEPAFQALIETIQCEQGSCRVEEVGRCVRCGRRDRPRDFRPLRVMALSATARSSGHDNVGTIGLKAPDHEHPIVRRRINASKTLHLHPCEDEKKRLAADIADRATTSKHLESGSAILIFVRFVQDVERVVEALRKASKRATQPQHIVTLTGTMRGLERDDLVRNPAFIRFLQESDRPEDVTPAEGTVHLVCTSAGEVGVDLSADHMVCDLSTFDSMAQRLGRVNRFGDRDDTRVDVVHSTTFDDKRPNPQRKATLALLQQLDRDASPKGLGKLRADRCFAAFSPVPTILPATDILFDAWALTTIRERMPGRPPVAPYLHGVAEWEPPRTSVAWREEVERITDELIEREGFDFPQELLSDYPLKPHELLNDRSDRVYNALRAMIAEPKKSLKGEQRRLAMDRANKNAATNIWLFDNMGSVEVKTLGELLDDNKERLLDRMADGIVLLPPSVGGLSAGVLDANSGHADDVADRWLDEHGNPRRGRVWDDAEPPAYEQDQNGRPMALIRTIDTDPVADDSAPPDEGSEALTKKRVWHWYARPRDAEVATLASTAPIAWDHHTRDVVSRASEIAKALNLPDDMQHAVILAAELHDLGKQREIWQRSIGNPNPTEPNWYAKPGKPADGPRWKPRHLSNYRHELGSLLDALHAKGDVVAGIADLSDEMRDVALHLIAAHHGYARPHFPPDAYDHERYKTQQNRDAAHEVMRRYARLQRRYGRWGLAYLESLLRAADWAASANPSDGTAEAEGTA